jgi:hypothetical protein
MHCALIVTGSSDAVMWIYACQTSADACVSDDDCPPLPGKDRGNCDYGGNGRYCSDTPE